MRLRTSAAAVLAVVAAALPAAPAAGQDRPRLRVAPAEVALGEQTVVRGARWPVFESCSRRVRLTLESAQNAAPIGRLRVRDSGRFAFRFTPEADAIGPGDWRVVARMRCERGDDGSPFTLRRAASLRIR
ncbi:MAG TPA: hypothetical protein VIL49_01365 [Capillimicrobium sp.]|jgi:hypothetical protein